MIPGPKQAPLAPHLHWRWMQSLDPRPGDRESLRTRWVPVAVLAGREFSSGNRSGNRSDAHSPFPSGSAAARRCWHPLLPAPFGATRPILSSPGNRTRWRTLCLFCAASLAAWRRCGWWSTWRAPPRRNSGRPIDIDASRPRDKSGCRDGTAKPNGGVWKVVEKWQRSIGGILGGWLCCLRCNEGASPPEESAESAAMAVCQGAKDGTESGGSEEMA